MTAALNYYLKSVDNHVSQPRKNTPPTGTAPVTNKFNWALLMTEGILRSYYD